MYVWIYVRVYMYRCMYVFWCDAVPTLWFNVVIGFTADFTYVQFGVVSIHHGIMYIGCPQTHTHIHVIPQSRLRQPKGININSYFFFIFVVLDFLQCAFNLLLWTESNISRFSIGIHYFTLTHNLTAVITILRNNYIINIFSYLLLLPFFTCDFVLANHSII